MIKELIEGLRGMSQFDYAGNIVKDAADAIEILQAENADLTAKCNHIMTAYGTLRTEAESLRKDAERISTLREAVIDAAEEWSQYVEVDSAPRRCSEHVGMAFDAAMSSNP